MLQVHVYRSRGMPVYFLAFAGTHPPTQEGQEAELALGYISRECNLNRRMLDLLGGVKVKE